MSQQEKTKAEDPENAMERSVRAFQDTSTDVAKDVGRFVQAWVEANTELAVGSLQVFGDLLVNVADAATPRRRGDTGGEKDDKSRDLIRPPADAISDISKHVSNAVSESSKVIQRSLDKFSKRYDRDTDGPVKGPVHAASKA